MICLAPKSRNYIKIYSSYSGRQKQSVLNNHVNHFLDFEPLVARNGLVC